MMDVLWVILIVIIYVGTIFFLLIKEEKQYNKLIKEYNELVDDYNCQESLVANYENKIGELLKILRELNNLSLDNIKNDK